MPIQLECPGCSKMFRVADEHAGKRVKCPGCQTIFQVPQADSPTEHRAEEPSMESTPPQPGPTYTPRPTPRDSNVGGGMEKENVGPSDYPRPSASASPYQPSQYAAASYQPAAPPSAEQTMGQISLVLGVVALVGEFILPFFFFCCCGALAAIIPAAMTIPAGVGLAMAFKAEGGMRTAAMIVNSIALVIGMLAIIGLIALFVLYGALIFQAQQNQRGGF